MNLTRVSLLVKKVFKYIAIVVSAYYIVVLVLFPGSVKIIRSLLYRSDPPNVLFGVLDPLEFIEKPIDKTQLEYVLNTKNGKLPQNIPSKAKVYKFKPQQYSYLAGNNAIDDAKKLGFTEKDLVSDLKGNIYRWRNPSTGSTLNIDIGNRTLNLSTNLNSRSMDFTPGLINQESAIEIAKKTLSSINRFNDPLYKSGEQTVKLGYFVGNKIYETTNFKEAQIALVDFYRSVDEYNILGPDPSKGLLRIYVRNPSHDPNPMNTPIMDIYYWEIVTPTEAEYPIIPVKDAWEAVKNGRGVITKVVPRGSNPFEPYTSAVVEKILIDNIYLAYYETPKFQTYMQPIYVFSGTYTTRGTSGGDIAIYFPAVSGEYTKQIQQGQTQN